MQDLMDAADFLEEPASVTSLSYADRSFLRELDRLLDMYSGDPGARLDG